MITSIKTRVLSAPGIHYALSRFGWPSLKSAAFSAKFDSGSWDHYEEPKAMVELIEEVNAGGSILALGCGGNPLGRALRLKSYSAFTGVDISASAVALAKKHSPVHQTFFVSDMLDFKSDESFSTIVFSESLYFIPNHEKNIVPLLNYWSSRLNDGGNIVVTTVAPTRYSTMLRLIRDNFIVSKETQLASNRIALTFR